MDLIWFLNCPSFYQKVINLPFTITSLGSGGRWGGWSEIQLLDSLRVGTAKVTDQTDTDRHMLSKDQGESGSRAEVWPQPRCAGAQRPGSCGALCYVVQLWSLDGLWSKGLVACQEFFPKHIYLF